MRRCIGLDVHREFAQVAVWEDGLVRQAGRIELTPEGLRAFAASLCVTDEVALEATGNTHAIARLLEQHVGRVVVSNPQKTRAIAEPRSRPTRSTRRCWWGCWRPTTCRRCGCRTRPPSRCAARSPAGPTSCGSGPGRRNQVQSILHRNLVPRCPAADLLGTKGRAWLAAQDLPPDEHQAVGALLRQLDFHGQELRIVDAELGRVALEREEVRRLLTIPGVDATVALAIVAAVGDFGRFSSPQRLVGYLGLNPRVRQSGGQPAQHGRITKQGRAHARGMLVEAAWAAAKTPGPLRAFYERVRARRGMQVAVVATARKLATLCWHLVVSEQDYAFARPSLTDKKLRALELRAGLPARRGQKGTAAAYSLKEVRRRERALAEQAEVAYRQLVAGWQPKPPAKQQPNRGVAAATGARR